MKENSLLGGIVPNPVLVAKSNNNFAFNVYWSYILISPLNTSQEINVVYATFELLLIA